MTVTTLICLMAALMGAGCGGRSTGPSEDDLIPRPGSKGSGVTNSVGVAELNLNGVKTTVSVQDAQGAPAVGVRVGATVGRDFIVLVAGDLSGIHPPGLAVYPVSRLAAPAPGLVPREEAGPQAAPVLLIPLLIKLAPYVSGALAIHELYYDPIHQQLQVDDGLLKSCLAGDIRDLIALGGVIGSHVVNVAVVSAASKARAFASLIDPGLVALTIIMEFLEFTDTDRIIPGTCTVLVGDKDFSAMIVLLSGVVGGGIFAQDNQLPSNLYVVEPTQDGADIEVAQVRTAQGASLSITDMAHWDVGRAQNPSAALSHPVLYAVSLNTLYRLNRRTGVATPLGSLGNRGINALAFDYQGNLFAAGASGELLRINPTTGTIQQIIALSPSVATSGDLVFLPNGRLLATVLGGVGGDFLVEINPVTGAVQAVGTVGYDGVYGLSYFDGVLWGLTVDRELLTINPSTGAGAFMRGLTFRANGGSVGPH